MRRRHRTHHAMAGVGPWQYGFLLGSALLTLALGCGKAGRTLYRVGGLGPEGVGAAGASGIESEPPLEPRADCATSIEAAEQHFCATYEDGSVWCFGRDSSAEPEVVEGLSGILLLALGPSHACAVDDQHRLWCWGDNQHHQISPMGSSPLRATQLPVLQPTRLGLGPAHTCVVNSSEKVSCWGEGAQLSESPAQPIEELAETDTSWHPVAGATEMLDGYGRLYRLDRLLQQLPEGRYGNGNMWVGHGATQTCALKRNGSLWCSDADAAPDAPLEARIALGETVVQAGIGDAFLCALTREGQVWCEGENAVGQLGRGNEGGAMPGDFVPGLAGVRRLAVSRSGACALDAAGGLWCWGAFAAGRRSATPTQVTGCSGASRAVNLASAEWDSLGPTPAWRLEAAALARAQALCRCANGDLAGDCVAAENGAPNGLCLQRVMDPRDQAAVDCEAVRLWSEAACWASAACGTSNLPNCLPTQVCPSAAVPEAWGFCRLRPCAGARDQYVDGSMMCDNVPDCADSSDERNCEAGPSFECQDGPAPAETFGLCDGKADCADASDEICL